LRFVEEEATSDAHATVAGSPLPPTVEVAKASRMHVDDPRERSRELPGTHRPRLTLRAQLRDREALTRDEPGLDAGSVVVHG